MEYGGSSLGVVAAEPHADSAGRRLQVHLAPGQYERWQDAAKSSGASLSEFVRSSVEERLAEPSPGALTEGIAHAVSAEMLPEIERLLMKRLPGASPESVGASLPAPLPTVPVRVGPRAWDPSCHTADLHRHGVLCTECGGSFLGRR